MRRMLLCDLVVIRRQLPQIALIGLLCALILSIVSVSMAAVAVIMPAAPRERANSSRATFCERGRPHPSLASHPRPTSPASPSSLSAGSPASTTGLLLCGFLRRSVGMGYREWRRVTGKPEPPEDGGTQLTFVVMGAVRLRSGTILSARSTGA